MKWEEGVVYKISPKTKKSVVYIQIYEKGSLEIKYEEAYRSGWVTVLGDEMLGGYMSLEEMRGDSNSDGTDVWSLPTEGHEFLDGVSDGITYPETLSEADRDQLESIYYEEGTDGLENMGWEQVDSELLFFGKLNIDKV
jgi:hypothetical protein